VYKTGVVELDKMTMQIRHLWYFTQKKRNLEGFFVPKLFETEMILNNQIKYLGVIQDSKINWKFHIDNRIRKTSIAYSQCRRVIGKTRGLKPKVVYWINTSVIRSILAYAVLVWWKKTHLTTVKKTVWSYPTDYLLGFDRLYEHHTYSSNGDPPGSTMSASCG
jgi:hypothetical protein